MEKGTGTRGCAGRHIEPGEYRTVMEVCQRPKDEPRDSPFCPRRADRALCTAMRRPGGDFLLVLGVATYLAVAAPAPGREIPGAWRDHLIAGRDALAGGDLATARAELTTLDSLVGGHSGAMYALAQIAARSGQRTEMLRWLEDAARTGIE